MVSLTPPPSLSTLNPHSFSYCIFIWANISPPLCARTSYMDGPIMHFAVCKVERNVSFPSRRAIKLPDDDDENAKMRNKAVRVRGTKFVPRRMNQAANEEVMAIHLLKYSNSKLEPRWVNVQLEQHLSATRIDHKLLFLFANGITLKCWEISGRFQTSGD